MAAQHYHSCWEAGNEGSSAKNSIYKDWVMGLEAPTTPSHELSEQSPGGREGAVDTGWEGSQACKPLSREEQ